VVYEPELEGVLNDLRSLVASLRSFNVGAEDEEDDQDMRWDWDVPPPPAILRGHHHHHHRHGLHEVLGMMRGDHYGGMLASYL
jgi:hypothetical protein